MSELPKKPNLEHLKKQAKDRLRDLQQGDPAAKLSDAQHAIAREYGFANWSKLKEHVESLLRVLEPAEKLTAAVRASDAAAVSQLLESNPGLKAQINEPLPKYGAGMQAMLAAVQRSDRQTIEVLLHAGADINARSHGSPGGVGVLDECSPEMAEFLMQRGAVVDVHSSARLGMFEKVRELLAANPVSVQTPGANGQTPLHCASTLEIAKYLLEHGAAIDARDAEHESTPAQHMLRVVQARHYPNDRQEIARHLVAAGCQSDILMAAALGDLPLVRRLLEAYPNCIRTRVTEAYFPKQSIYVEIFGANRTPHLIAKDFEHPDVFQFLMSQTPDDVKLAQACELGDEPTFRAFLAGHPNLVATLTDEGRRHLPDAAQNNNPEAVRLMLAAGWPVDFKGELGLAAIDWASWHGNAEMVREILRYHPKLDTKENEHEVTTMVSALHGSENSWHRDTGDYAAVVQALLDAGAQAPKVTDDLEASEAAREVLIEHELRQD